MSLVDSTVTVRRGGSYLTVPANAVDRYLAKGYDVVDETDNVIKTSIPNDVNALKVAYNKHVAEIKELKEQIHKLERQLEAKPIVAEKVDKVEKVVEKPVIVTPAKSTARRTKKS